MAGGVVRSRDRGIVGEAAVDFIRQFGWTSPSLASRGSRTTARCAISTHREVKVAQTIVEHAREVWLAADHSKFNRPAMVRLATLDQIDRLFTDAPPPAPFPALLESADVELVLATH